MNKTEIKMWRYYLPTVKGDGWAEIVIASSGFFGAVSDYGNYAFAWRHTGCDDVRKFFLKASEEWDYFAGKLGGEHATIYDGEATLRLVKEHLLAARRTLSISKEEAREEWGILREHEGLGHRENFAAWLHETKRGNAWEMACSRIRPQLEHFCKVTMGRLAEAIRAELAAEAKVAWMPIDESLKTNSFGTCTLCPYHGPDPRHDCDPHHCKLCGKPRYKWQVFCGAACSAKWEAGERSAGVDDEVKKREPGCKCQLEEGDSPCPVHGEDE